MSRKVSLEQEARRQTAAKYRKEAVYGLLVEFPNQSKSVSWFTTKLGENKFDPLQNRFTRTALRQLIQEGLVEKTQRICHGKTTNFYKLKAE